MVQHLAANGYPVTASNFYKLKQVAYKLSKKYRLIHMFEDIFQTVLFTACKKEQRYDSTKSAFSTYIYIIAERIIINTYIRPLSTFTLGKKIQDYNKEVKQETGESPTISEMASKFDVSEDEVRSTFLYHSAENDFRLLQDSFSSMQEDDPLSYLMELDELFTKGFQSLSDLQRAIIEELIIRDSSHEVAAAKLGITQEVLNQEYQTALQILKEYVQ